MEGPALIYGNFLNQQKQKVLKNIFCNKTKLKKQQPCI